MPQSSLIHMEKMGPLVGSRYSDFTKSFKLAIRSLLTSCSKEEFIKAFSNFSSAEQESLHRLFVQVITSLHKMIEDEFESLSLETLVGTTLDTVDQLVEEQSLDPLFSNKLKNRIASFKLVLNNSRKGGKIPLVQQMLTS
ncbi:uncharacterized protein LOC110623994 isoform X4 [Manihot esculenta]|uniref:uncharacterized protein LOC110623994 isoform X4 n=1 Tax=Manihot esculenta TaxID=3983 RepID=UPI001CC58B13|nr:uncharacterized protein LOC110623994 isoform X4 [Manihot esculenta]